MGVRLHALYRPLSNVLERPQGQLQFDALVPLPSPPIPPAPLSACGLMEFLWANNQLSGPFLGEQQNELFICGCDGAAQKRVVMFYSADYGETWVTINDVLPVLANIIGSMEARQDSFGSILVATQERVTGRVAFSMFSPISKTWLTINSEVIAAPAPSNFWVSVDRRSNGDVAVFYQSAPEVIVLVPYARMAFKFSSNNGGSWSAENLLGHTGQPTNDTPHRVMGGHAVSTFNFIFDNGGNDLFIQSWSALNVLGAVTVALNVLDGPLNPAGRPIAYNDGTPKLALPESLSFSRDLNMVIFNDTDPAGAAASFGTIGGSLNCYEGTGAPNFVDAGLTMVAQVRNGFAPPQLDWVFWQSGGPGAWAPADQSLYIGPKMALAGNFGNSSGLTWKIAGVTYVGAVINIGPASNQNGFQLAKASTLPIPNPAENVAAWTAACAV